MIGLDKAWSDMCPVLFNLGFNKIWLLSIIVQVHADVDTVTPFKHAHTRTTTTHISLLHSSYDGRVTCVSVARHVGKPVSDNAITREHFLVGSQMYAACCISCK
jgi:hypothetical protein